MAAKAESVANDVASRARGLLIYLNRLERLHDERRLYDVDLHRAYAGAWISFTAFCEQSIERLFLGLLTGALEISRAAVSPRTVVRSPVVARDIVYAGRPYVDWLPYERTIERAEAFLLHGRPFTELSNDEEAKLAGLGVLRNALAHESRYAVGRFEKRFVVGRKLPPYQKKPAGYLRGMHDKKRTRFEYESTEVAQVFLTLSR